MQFKASNNEIVIHVWKEKEEKNVEKKKDTKVERKYNNEVHRPPQM